MENKALFKNKYRIKSTRLNCWDYSNPGFYFVTICIKNKIKMFGEIINEKMVSNRLEYIVKHCWRDLPNHYKNCILDSFVIMPNHFHGIIKIKYVNFNKHVEMGLQPISEAGYKPASTEYKPYPLFEMIRGFKTFSSKKINLVNHAICFRWQTSYYEHIIRTENDLWKCRKYIQNNPSN